MPQTGSVGAALLEDVSADGEAVRHKQGTDLTPHEKLAKERIALLNEGKSEKITLHTTDLKNADNSAAGTRVVIQFPTSILED